MIPFGIMSLNLESEETYINDVARFSEVCGMECFRFVPSSIDPHSLKVKGRRFDHASQSWIDCDFPVPTILYDRCFYGDDEHSKQCIPIVSWLKSRKDITFLGYGLPNKLDLYNTLRKSKLAPYLPPSVKINNVETVLNELMVQNRLILKPINGSQGYGIYYLKKNDKTFHVKTEKHSKIISRIFPNERKLTEWLHSLLKNRSYLLQPFLELSNEELKPFDIRILLQKNEQGEWVERGKGVREGNTGGILSNLSAGGTAINFSEWIRTQTSSKRTYIRNELEYIMTNLPPLLENEFLPLFELGLDIGVAKNGSIWILDVNSKPGRKVLLTTKPELKDTLSLAPLLYGKYIKETNTPERKNYYAKTLSH